LCLPDKYITFPKKNQVLFDKIFTLIFLPLTKRLFYCKFIYIRFYKWR